MSFGDVIYPNLILNKTTRHIFGCSSEFVAIHIIESEDIFLVLYFIYSLLNTVSNTVTINLQQVDDFALSFVVDSSNHFIL